MDIASCKADFPLLEQTAHGRPLVYLDSASSSQRPRVVLDAMDNYYETTHANVHRGVYAIAEEADFGFYPHDACGSFYISLTTDPARCDEALQIALAEMRRVKSDLNADEVERAKNKIASSLVLSGEVPSGRMRSIGSQWIYNKQYRPLELDMATLMAVTPDSLQELMDDFTFDPMTIVSLGPGK